MTHTRTAFTSLSSLREYFVGFGSPINAFCHILANDTTKNKEMQVFSFGIDKAMGKWYNNQNKCANKEREGHTYVSAFGRSDSAHILG